MLRPRRPGQPWLPPWRLQLQLRLRLPMPLRSAWPKPQPIRTAWRSRPSWLPGRKQQEQTPKPKPSRMSETIPWQSPL